MTLIIDMEELTRITDKLCNTFYRVAERHRKRMTKIMLKRKPMKMNGGKEIRLPMNYGDRE